VNDFTSNNYYVTPQHCSVLQALCLNFLVTKFTVQKNHIHEIGIAQTV